VPKTGKRGARYAAAQKARIMAAAKNGGLTGDQVAKQFGVSKLTFYRWRGPVRSDAVARRGGKRGPGRPPGNGRVKVDAAAVRRAVQEQVKKMLPQIIRERAVVGSGGTCCIRSHGVATGTCCPVCTRSERTLGRRQGQ
jgi:transposase-like protein